jgi:hypothetical protein
MSRSSMADLITRVRVLINDTGSATFTDDEVQNVLDETRLDIANEALMYEITYSTTATEYLYYYSKRGGGWETDYSIKQNLTTTVTPSSDNLIVGKFAFSSSTDPALFITGKLYDVYKAAADLLERHAVQYTLAYDVMANNQTLSRSQIIKNMHSVIKHYRSLQRPRTIKIGRSDIQPRGRSILGIRGIDMIASGD